MGPASVTGLKARHRRQIFRHGVVPAQRWITSIAIHRDVGPRPSMPSDSSAWFSPGLFLLFSLSHFFHSTCPSFSVSLIFSCLHARTERVAVVRGTREAKGTGRVFIVNLISGRESPRATQLTGCNESNMVRAERDRRESPPVNLLAPSSLAEVVH